MAINSRCVNIDWLEVHCIEPSATFLNAEYYRNLGYYVVERDYGTRVYNEMFTVYIDGNPFIEVRRNPSSQGVLGIHDAGECHLRLVNAACYFDDAVDRLRAFLDAHGYTFKRISRIDICMDFERFDSGDMPADFVRRYMSHKYAKINQGNITGHGKDSWDGQKWNSLSWGSPSSQISTKMYDKTLELFDPKTRTYGKPHVRYAWWLSGLIDDFHFVTKQDKDGNIYTPQIWRVEFSIKSSVKNWFRIEIDGKSKNYQSVRNNLSMYDNRDKLLVMFSALARHYFRFKYFEEGKRKDRCKDKELFRFGQEEYTYKVSREDANKLLADMRKERTPLDALLAKLKAYAATHSVGQVHDACEIIINSIESEILRVDVRQPFSRVELQALRTALHRKVDGDTNDVAVVIREIKKLLSLNDERIFGEKEP